MWKERMKKASPLLYCVIFILLEICGYVLCYYESRFYRMSFLVIGDWIMSEKAILGLYIAAAVMGNIVFFLSKDEKKHSGNRDGYVGAGNVFDYHIPSGMRRMDDFYSIFPLCSLPAFLERPGRMAVFCRKTQKKNAAHSASQA